MADTQTYYDYTRTPWGKLFYRILWEQLPPLRAERVLDFGSGFGITASHFAAHSRVTAIEPNLEMREMRLRENDYEQVAGGIEALRGFADGSFDCVLCHNVLEYIEAKEEHIAEFSRLLKAGGNLSLVKHNRLGKVMQKAVFQNDMREAARILRGGAAETLHFGDVKAYDRNDFAAWMLKFGFKETAWLGIRTFYALHPDNTIRHDEKWIEAVFDLEMLSGGVEELRNIAFYHHLIWEKI